MGISDQRNYVIEYETGHRERLLSALEGYSVHSSSLADIVLVRVRPEEEPALLERLASLEHVQYHRALPRSAKGDK